MIQPFQLSTRAKLNADLLLVNVFFGGKTRFFEEIAAKIAILAAENDVKFRPEPASSADIRLFFLVRVPHLRESAVADELR